MDESSPYPPQGETPLSDARWELFAQARASGAAFRQSLKAGGMSGSRSLKARRVEAEAPQIQARIRLLKELPAWGAGADPQSRQLALLARQAARSGGASGLAAAGRLIETAIRVRDAGPAPSGEAATTGEDAPVFAPFPDQLSEDEWDAKFAALVTTA